MSKRALSITTALLGLLILGFALGPRVEVDTEVEAPALPADIDAWLAASEAAYPDIIPGADKRIIWANPETRARTALSVVYLHGFSATRQEIVPVCERVATQLGANLFYTRLTGHGRGSEPMAEASVQSWLQDGAEALAIGQRLGERVVLVGTSTGGTLATWLAHHNPDLASLILLSPNFGIPDPSAGLLTLPWGGQLAQMIVGEYRSWEPANQAQGMYWTTRYPTVALLPMMALVELVGDLDLSHINIPTLVLYSPDDDVIDPGAIEARFEEFGAYRKAIIPLNPLASESTHVITGDILSPSTVDESIRRITAFVRGNR